MDFSSFTGFEWDLGNIAKVQRRLDLATVEFAFQGSPYVAFDERHSDGERRRFLVNRVQNRHIFVVFTTRGDRIRVISARYMRKKEAQAYEKYFSQG